MLPLCNRASRGTRRNYLALIFFGFALSFSPETVLAATLPAGFQETVAFSGLTNPTAVRFASDGRVFVAEKRGVIKVFNNLSDPTPDEFADLRTQVYDYWDRGLLGLALDPNFPTSPYVYVLYTYDFDPNYGGPQPPRWNDACSDPTGTGCVAMGRLSRLTANGNVMVPGSEMVFQTNWCQQFPSHSIGSLAFGADGKLYVSGGDGASFTFEDYGQKGSPLNPCNDPPVPVGGQQTPPTAEGGALRSQDLRTTGDPSSDPQTLDGTILRIDTATGEAPADNPLNSNPDPKARLVIASGLRNPFRFTIRPGTNEVWLGDVGWSSWEEINWISNPIDSTVENFGWPCYEGNDQQAGYNSADLNICENLYLQNGAVVNPFFTYFHGSKVVPNESCPSGSSSIAGLAFYLNGPYPDNFDGALFFADYSRDCIWVIYKGADGLPNKFDIATFVASAANPVDLQVNSAGDLYYADFDGGTIRRVQYVGSNQPPNAVLTANPTTGNPPLTVNFDGSNSSDPNPGDTISYAWDLDGDGQFDDFGNNAFATFTYQTVGSYTATLKTTDNLGLFDTASVLINVGNNAPTAFIDTPAPGTTWKVGDVISFSGHATDPEQGTLPASALSWSVILQHCPSNCHPHVIQTFDGVASGSFQAMDHEYPSYIEIQLTAKDNQGLTDIKTLRLDPRTVVLTFKSKPGALQLAVNGASGTTTFTRTVIVGSTNSISATTPQTKGGKTYKFSSWSDGGAQTHIITAPDKNKSYTADYVRQ